jgi:hypothetical protein
MAVTTKNAPRTPGMPGTPARARRGRGTWMAVGVLGLAGFLAVETGWAGFGLAHLKSMIYPTDAGLLEWVPGDTGSVVVFDPHQLVQESLGKEGGAVRSALQRTRDDVKRATGIDLAFDVDKVVFTPALVVARGRFDPKKLAEKLAEHHYAMAEHKGEVYLVRAGEDAIGVSDGSVLLYGDEAALKAAIDAHQAGTSLEKNDDLTSRLSRVGYKHAVLASIRLTDDKPSVRAMLSGATGPRAVTIGVTTLAAKDKGATAPGLDVDGVVEAASPSAASELAKLLEEKRKNAETFHELLGKPEPSAGTDPAAILEDIAKKASVSNVAPSADVKIHARVDPAQVETLARTLGSSAPLAGLYKDVRLFQLLAP